MATSLVYALPDGTMTSITFDAASEQAHEAEAEVTEDPVEDGAPISDHVRPVPRKVQLTVHVSNTPIEQPPDQMNGVTGSVQAFQIDKDVTANVMRWSGAFDRVKTIHGELDRLRESGTVVQLVTSLKTYENMILRSISARRTAAVGNALEATLSLVQIRIVQTTTAAVPATPRATRRRGNGNQTPAGQPAGQPANAGASSMLANLTGLGRSILP